MSGTFLRSYTPLISKFSGYSFIILPIFSWLYAFILIHLKAVIYPTHQSTYLKPIAEEVTSFRSII
jgi:hypothetical protein